MASVLVQAMGGNASITTGNTRNFPASSGGLSPLTTEANAQRTTQTPGIWARMAVRVITNASNNTTTFFFRKNSANGNQNVSYAAGETGVKQDLTNTDTTVAGDIINYQGINSGTGTIDIAGISASFTASTNTTQPYHFNITLNAFNFGTTNYFTISGDGVGTNVRTDNEIKMGTAGTFHNLGVRLTTNTLDVTGTATFTLMKSAVAQTLTVTFASGETGYKTDIVNSVVVAVDDLFSMQNVNTGVVGAITVAIGHLSLTTTNNKTDYVSNNRTTRIVAQTRFFNFIGSAGASPTETSQSFLAQVGATLSNLRANVTANTWTSNFTVNLRKNLANANSVLVFATTETGWKHDLVNTDTVIPTDLLDYMHTTSAGSGSITVGNTVITAEMFPSGGSTLLLMGCG